MARVLVVDDERGLRITIKAFLEEDGHHVSTAQSFEEARQAISSEKFDVVVFDIVLPGGSGVELLQELRRFSPSTLGILITGDPSVDTATEALRTGAFDYLRKPVSKAIISRVVANAARIKSLNDERERLDRENQAYREHLEELVEQRTRELKESELRYRLIAENASDVIWTADFDLRETFITPSVERVFGRTQEQSGQMTLQDKLSPESWEIVRRRFEEIKSSGRLEDLPPDSVVTLELQEYHIDGHPIWVEIQAGLLRDDNGKPIGILGVTRDISQRKAEELLRKKSEERLMLALEGTEAGLWDWNVKTNDVYLSPLWAQTLGYDSDYLKSRSDFFAELIHPDDIDMVQLAVSKHFEELAPSFESSFRLKTRDGQWKWILARGKVVDKDEQGHPLRMVGTHLDISDEHRLQEILRENEAKYRNLVELGSDGVCIIQDYKFVYVNKRLSQMLHSSPEEMTGRPFTDFIAPEEQGFMKSLHDMHINGQREMGIFDTVVIDSSGCRLQVEVNASIIPYGDGEAEMVAVRDISARKQAEKEIHRLNQFRKSVIDNASVWLAVMDEENRILIWNKAAERISGYSRDEVVGTDGVWRKLFPYGAYGEFIAGLERSNLRNGEEHFETSIITRNNQEVFISWSSRRLLDEDGQFIGSIMLGNDISDRRRSMEALQRSEEMIRSTLHSMSDMVFVVDRNGNMQDFHQPALERKLYVPPQDFIGKPFESILPADISAKFTEAIKQVAADGHTACVEYPLHIGDQDYWFSARISMRRDVLGRYDGVTMVVRDDTERKQAEEQLRHSEAQLRGIVTSLTRSALVLVSRDGTYLAAWSDAEFERRVGTPCEHLVGRNMADVIPPDKLNRFMEAIGRVADTRESIQLEYSVPGADGRILWHEVTLSPMIKGEDEVPSVVIMIHDVTERKEAEDAMQASEQQLRGIVTSLHNNAIMVINREGLTLSAWADRDFETKSGFSAEFFIGNNIKDLMPPEEWGWRMKMIEDIYLTGRSSGSEYRIPTPDGRIVWHESRNSAMLDENGNVKAVVVLMHDITDRKRAEEALLTREAFENLIMSISTEFVNMKSEEIDAGIENALKAIGEFADTDRSYIFLFNESGDECSNTHEWCRDGITSEKDHLQNCRTADMAWWAHELEESRIVYLRSLDDMPPEATAEREVLQAQGIVSLLVVPMYYSGRLIGFLGFDSVRGPKEWNEEIIKLLRVVSDLLAGACMRKNYEHELRQSEERYRLIAENQSDVIWTLDRKLNYSYISPSIKALRGYDPVEVMSTGRIIEAVEPESLAALKAIVDAETSLEIQGGGDPRRTLKLETRVKHRDGHSIWVEVHINYLRDRDNRFMGVLGVTRDISDRKQAEMQLRRSEELYRTVVENSGEGIIIMDRDGRCLFINGTAAERRGGRAEDFIGRTLFDVYPHEVAERKLQAIQRVFDSGAGEAAEYQIPVAGEWRWFRILLQPLKDSDGRTYAVMVLSFDTDRQRRLLRELNQSREDVNTIFSNIQEFFIIFDENGLILHANPYTHINLGYSENEMAGLDIGRFIAADFIRGREQLFAGVPEEGAKTMFIPFVSRDGRWIYTESRISKGRWEGREVFFGICRDLSDRIKAEKDLKESEATASTLLNLMPSIAMLIDPQGPILAVNQKALESMGLSEEEMLGKTPFDLFGREVAEHRVTFFLDAIRKRCPVEFEDERAGRQFRHIVVPMFDDNGEIMRFAVFTSEIEKYDRFLS